MEPTSAPATSSCGPELLVPLYVARRANRTKVKATAKVELPAAEPSTTVEADSNSLFL